jgi:3',5'-cyclic AMP phosphodiesterase CpdA
MKRIRLAHISDIHISAPGCQWRRDDWLNKRMAAWLNLRILGRGLLFRHTDDIVTALMAELRQRKPDRVVFSGDATALGFEEEVLRAASMLGLHGPERLPGLAVPGNHDYCTHRAADSGHFEQHFACWQEGERIDGSLYPFAQRVGPAWLIGVNSATANRWPWDASGGVGSEQLERLRQLLRRLDGGPKILVTHYPATRSSGKLEWRTHRLRDVHALAEVAQEGGIGLWLHGHLHHPHEHQSTFLTPYPVICAGSTTQLSRWSYGEYTIDGHHLSGLRRVYDPDTKQFQDAEMFDMDLPETAPRL